MEYKYIFSKEKNRLHIKRSFSGKVLSNFARGMKNNLKAGIPIIESLELTKSYCTKSLKSAVSVIQERVEEGFTLEEAFKKFDYGFPNLFRVMIGIGEESGNLEEVFSFLERYYMKEYIRHKKLENISIYPVFTLSLSLVLGLFMIAKILPKFLAVIDTDKKSLPAITRFYIAVSDGINSLGILAVPFLAIIALTIAAAIARINKTKAFSRFLYNNFLLRGLIRNRFESRFTLAMWMMVKSGIDFRTSIEIFSESENKYLRGRLEKCIEELAKGSMICDSMKSAGIFSDYLLANIKIGEINGSLDDVLKTAGEVIDEESNFAMDRMVGFMEPLLIIVVGAFVLSIVLSIVIPMMKIYDISI